MRLREDSFRRHPDGLPEELLRVEECGLFASPHEAVATPEGVDVADDLREAPLFIHSHRDDARLGVRAALAADTGRAAGLREDLVLGGRRGAERGGVGRVGEEWSCHGTAYV